MSSASGEVGDAPIRDDLLGAFLLKVRSISDTVVQNVNGRELQTWRRDARPLGVGGFGAAWLWRDDRGGLRVVKEVMKSTPNTEVLYWKREISAMALLSRNQDDFPHFHGWFQDEERAYMAMEFCPLGDLWHCVTEPLAEIQAKSITTQVCHALQEIHEVGITHRDLKPNNILIRKGPPAWHVILCDFGVSKRIHNLDTTLYTSVQGLFAAPEMQGVTVPDADEPWKYTNAVDLWSLGCIAFWLLTHDLPLPLAKLMTYCESPFPDCLGMITWGKLETAAKGLVSALLHPDPRYRLTALQASEHEWLAQALPAPVESSATPIETCRDIPNTGNAWVTDLHDLNAPSASFSAQDWVNALSSSEDKPIEFDSPVNPNAVLERQRSPYRVSSSPVSQLPSKTTDPTLHDTQSPLVAGSAEHTAVPLRPKRHLRENSTHQSANSIGGQAYAASPPNRDRLPAIDDPRPIADQPRGLRASPQPKEERSMLDYLGVRERKPLINDQRPVPQQARNSRQNSEAKGARSMLDHLGIKEHRIPYHDSYTVSGQPPEVRADQEVPKKDIMSPTSEQPRITDTKFQRRTERNSARRLPSEETKYATRPDYKSNPSDDEYYYERRVREVPLEPQKPSREPRPADDDYFYERRVREVPLEPQKPSREPRPADDDYFYERRVREVPPGPQKSTHESVSSDNDYYYERRVREVPRERQKPGYEADASDDEYFYERRVREVPPEPQTPRKSRRRPEDVTGDYSYEKPRADFPPPSNVQGNIVEYGGRPNGAKSSNTSPSTTSFLTRNQFLAARAEREKGGVTSSTSDLFSAWDRLGATSRQQQPDDCLACKGDVMREWDFDRCHRCRGRGTIDSSTSTKLKVKCPNCNGEGRVKRCRRCRGIGLDPFHKTDQTLDSKNDLPCVSCKGIGRAPLFHTTECRKQQSSEVIV